MKNSKIPNSRLLIALISAFCLFTWTVSVFGADQKPAKQSQQATEYKIEDMQFKAASKRKLASIYNKTQLDEAAQRVKLGKAPKFPKSDLVCSIKAYYDEAHTMPVQSLAPTVGLYDFSPQKSPTRLLKGRVYFVFEVKNIGTKALNVTNSFKATFTPQIYPPMQFITDPENFDLGEGIEFDFSFGPFSSAAYMNGKTINLTGQADYPPKIAEGNEVNNLCNYKLMFRSH